MVACPGGASGETDTRPVPRFSPLANDGDQGMTMSRKVLVAAALAAGFTVGVGAPVLAGEVNGRGGATPVARPEEGGRSVAGSICAFSGLDDGSESGAGVVPGVTQSWGQVVRGFAAEGGVGSQTEGGDLQSFGPGTECRGFASGGR